MVDPTFSEQLGALIFLLAFVALLVACVVGISIRAARLMQKLNAGKLNAEIDARILIAENVNVNADPTVPFSPYAAVNEAREWRQRRR